eukprot:scaffold27248_cov133-Isochrysis_galbana.AAC.14
MPEKIDPNCVPPTPVRRSPSAPPVDSTSRSWPMPTRALRVSSLMRSTIVDDPVAQNGRCSRDTRLRRQLCGSRPVGANNVGDADESSGRRASDGFAAYGPRDWVVTLQPAAHCILGVCHSPLYRIVRAAISVGKSVHFRDSRDVRSRCREGRRKGTL